MFVQKDNEIRWKCVMNYRFVDLNSIKICGGPNTTTCTDGAKANYLVSNCIIS